MAAAAPQNTAETIMTFLPYVLVFGAMMWFMSIRPAMKRQKDQDSLLKNLKRGDRVLTTAGFYAEVDKIEDNGNLILKLADGVKVEFQKQSVVARVKEG